MFFYFLFYFLIQHLFYFFLQDYSRNPQNALEEIMKAYTNDSPEIEMDFHYFKKSFHDGKNIFLPQGDQLKRFYIEKKETRNLSEDTIHLGTHTPYAGWGEKIRVLHALLYCNMAAPGFLGLHERICKDLGIEFN